MSEVERLRSQITSDQRDILTTIWEHYLKTREWIKVQVLHGKHGGKKKARPQLEALRGIVFEQERNQDRYYELFFLGILLTDNGQRFEQLIVKYLEYVSQKCGQDPECMTVGSAEVATELKLSNEEITLLHVLVVEGRFYSPSSNPPGTDQWEFGIPKDWEDFPDDLLEYVHNRALVLYDANLPVPIAERQAYSLRKDYDDWQRTLKSSDTGNIELSDGTKMNPLVQELIEIHEELNSFVTEATPPEIISELDALEESAQAVGRAWSRSWIGYQANVYYGDLQPPPPGAHFSSEWGFYNAIAGSSKGKWKEFDVDEVISAIQAPINRGVDINHAARKNGLMLRPRGRWC